MPKPAKVATMVGRARRARRQKSVGRGFQPRRLHGRATEKPPRTRKRASGGTYATAYSSFTRKPLIFSMKAKYDGALRVQSRGVLSYSIFIRALSGASREIEFRECAALLLPPTLLSQQVAAKEEGCGNVW